MIWLCHWSAVECELPLLFFLNCHHVINEPVDSEYSESIDTNVAVRRRISGVNGA